MAIKPRSSSRCIRYTLAVLALSQGAFSAFSASTSTDFVVYWGQNSAGVTGSAPQKRLADYCADPNFSVINLAFLDQIVTPTLNLYDQGDYCSFSAASPSYDSNATLPTCIDIGNDITTCQNTYGKNVLLSIGGATYTEGGFGTPNAAVLAAQNIWAMFGPTRSPPCNTTTNTTTIRPFGSASVNGFDLDIEGPTLNMVPFANELRSLMDAASNYNSSFYLTAAPQCPYPDVWNNDMLSGAVAFDAVSVQFYNNACGLQSFVPTGANGTNTTSQVWFNFNVWDTWASTVSKNPNVRVLLGVPGGPMAAGSGYTAPSVVSEIIQYTKQFKSFGGAMAWDASQVDDNVGFAPAIKASLSALSSRAKYAMRPRRYKI